MYKRQVRYRTHFVKAILDTNTGEVLSETQPEVMDIIEGNGNTFELVRQGMKQDVYKRQGHQ